jgi:hypothetical protein
MVDIPREHLAHIASLYVLSTCCGLVIIVRTLHSTYSRRPLELVVPRVPRRAKPPRSEFGLVVCLLSYYLL